MPSRGPDEPESTERSGEEAERSGASRTRQERTDSAPAGENAHVITASIVAEDDDGGEVAYLMFEARDLSPERAFLAGSLLLELNEEFTVQLARGDARVKTRARVEALRHGDAPGMVVVFSELSTGDRNLLENGLCEPKVP